MGQDDERTAEIRREHGERLDTLDGVLKSRCYGDGQPWPCDAAHILARGDALRARAERYEQALLELRAYSVSNWWIVDAALAAGEGETPTGRDQA